MFRCWYSLVLQWMEPCILVGKPGMDVCSCLNWRGKFVHYICLTEELSDEALGVSILLSFITKA